MKQTLLSEFLQGQSLWARKEGVRLSLFLSFCLSGERILPRENCSVEIEREKKPALLRQKTEREDKEEWEKDRHKYIQRGREGYTLWTVWLWSMVLCVTAFNQGIVFFYYYYYYLLHRHNTTIINTLNNNRVLKMWTTFLIISLIFLLYFSANTIISKPYTLRHFWGLGAFKVFSGQCSWGKC